MKIDYDKYDIFIFDLDKTLWDSFDVVGKSIWAKQLILPYKLEGNKILDDVNSSCVLKPGAREYLNFLASKNKKIGFLSSGKLWGTEYENQPSVKILKIFNLYDFFNFKKELLYKTFSKNQCLKELSGCIFFDDNDDVIKEARELKNVEVVDSKKIENWKHLI